MNDNILISIRVLIVILIICIFLILSKKHIESFIDQDKEYIASNTRLNYRNTGELPWERHEIYSSLPIDIIVKYKEAYYYEYGNDEYEQKLREIFKNDCQQLIMAIEGTNWSNWINPKNNNKPDIILSYYNNIYNYIYNSINNSNILNLPNDTPPTKIQIVHDILRRFRQNKDDDSYFLFDIEMVLYREGKLQGKHFKFVVMSNNIIFNVIIVKLIGVVSEDNIIMHPIIPNDNNDSLNNNFDIFIPQKNINDNKISKLTDYDAIYSNTDKLVNSDIENQLYNKLLSSYNPEYIDNYNNNYHPQDELYNASIANDIPDNNFITDLKKNITNTKLQNNIREKFLNNLNNPIDETKNSNNIYKNYPYSDDIVHI